MLGSQAAAGAATATARGFNQSLRQAKHPCQNPPTCQLPLRRAVRRPSHVPMYAVGTIRRGREIGSGDKWLMLVFNMSRRHDLYLHHAITDIYRHTPLLCIKHCCDICIPQACANAKCQITISSFNRASQAAATKLPLVQHGNKYSTHFYVIRHPKRPLKKYNKSRCHR